MKMNKTQQLKNEEFVKNLFKLLYDGSLENLNKEDVIEYVAGHFTGLNVMTEEKIKEIRNNVKKSLEKEINIPEIISKFLGNELLDNITYNDHPNGIHFNINTDNCYYKMKLTYIDRKKGINLNLTKHIH